MIEKMKMVCVVSSLSHKQEMLNGLKQLGVLHIAEKKHADPKVSERFARLSAVSRTLQEFAPKKKKSGDQEKAPLLTGDDFEQFYDGVSKVLEKRESLIQERSAASAEIERIAPWGDFDPKEVRHLREAGIELHFCLIGEEEYRQIKESQDISVLSLGTAEKGRKRAIAVIGSLPQDMAASEFSLPERGISELKAFMASCDKDIAECENQLTEASRYGESLDRALLRAHNDENFSEAGQTAENDSELIWLNGYIPESAVEAFKQGARENGWAYAIDEVADDDENVPTKMKFNKVSVLIKPIYDLLGILPGYRETDISLWFFLFFTLFFAMIIGDAGYGCLILAATIAIVVKMKKNTTATYLLFVLSIATIVWGAVTGTWFGLEQAMDVPFLRALVIPNFSNYPELFGVTTTAQQNAVIKFSFTIGAVQMSLGSLIAIKKKIAEKNLSWIADLGWLIGVCSMYLLALYLIVGENIPLTPIFGCIALTFILVVLFSEMTPGRTFGQGLKAGLAGAFTTFLNTISCFGNVMSYIRLFAVGMAGLAISQSFNDIASGFGGPLVIVGVAVVLFGHALNLVMCFLSVAVHGVRLNVLEFSGQAGIEWTGIPYEPFKENDTIKK